MAALLLLMALCLQVQAATRTTVALDGAWRFQRTDVAGAEAPDFSDAAWPTVTLPHTYNAIDGEAGGAYYRGPVWYRRIVDLPAAARRRFLEFDGAALATDVWVNGRHAGRHEGGYARFRFDVTALLKPGRNTLAVRVDNGSLPTIAPLGGDFTVFGGLYRGVRLVETAQAHVDMLDHAGPGLEVATTGVSSTGANLQVKARLRNDTPSVRHLSLRLTLRDAAGHEVAHAQQAWRVPPASTEVAVLPMQLSRPHLWQGVHDPYLYRLTAEVLQGDAVVDEFSLSVGIRTIAVDPQRGFLLNGKPYPLHGVNYFHPGRPGKGLAVGDAEIGQPLARSEHRIEVQQRLAHAHEDAVVDRLGPPEVKRLVHDLRCAEVAGEAHRAGCAERARQGTARL